MKTIDNDIKTGQLKQAYLLYGEERYLLLQYRNKLKNALSSEDDNMNFSAFEGSDINPKEIIDLAETLPFFADNRLILIEGSGFFKKTCDELAAYLPTAPDTTHFIFVEDDVDKRSKMYKAVNKIGQAIAFTTQNDDTLQRWILSRLKKENKSITQQAYSLFIAKTGSDMSNIDRELEKLICYALDVEVITPEIVDAITTEQTQNKVFEMVDAISLHQQKHALDLYYDLLSLKEPPMRIMYLITRQFHLLALVKAMASRGFSNKDIATKAGCPEWAVRKYLTQCKPYSLSQLKELVQIGTEYEESVKTGHMNDQMAVELFICMASGKI